FDFSMGGQCAYRHLAVRNFNAGEPRNAGDVDQYLRRREAQVESREQALPAGEQARTVAVRVEQFEHLGERRGFAIGERWRFHAYFFEGASALGDGIVMSPRSAVKNVAYTTSSQLRGPWRAAIFARA